MNLSSFPNRADEVKVHDDCSSPEGGVVLPGGAGNPLGLGGNFLNRIPNSSATFELPENISFVETRISSLQKR